MRLRIKPYGAVRSSTHAPGARPVVMAFDRSLEGNRTKTEDGRLTIRESNFSKAAVNPYVGSEIPDWRALGLDPKKIYHLYRDPAELEKAAPTFDKVPLLYVHKPSTAADHPYTETIGTTGDGTRFDAPYLVGSLAVWAGKGVHAIESGWQRELSCGYRYRADMTPGRTPEGVPFDGVMRDLVGNHLTIVTEGRAGSDVVVGDSMEVLTMAARTTRAPRLLVTHGEQRGTATRLRIVKRGT